MSGPGTDRAAEDQLFEEAAEWFARMRAPDADSSRAGFESWLACGEAHRSAYNRAAEIFAMGKLLGEDRSRPDAGEAKPRQRRLPILASLGVLVLAIAATSLVLPPYRWHMPKAGQEDDRAVQLALLTAPPAKQRLVRLSDGSLVRLGGGTRVAIRFTGSRRTLNLDRGAARFAVAHEGRPFIVLAGGGAVTARGTIFEVALAPDRRVSVRLLRGSIDVRLPESDRQSALLASRRLRPGEAISFKAPEPATQALPQSKGNAGLETPRSSTDRAETRDYDSIRLADLVAAANRGASPPIRLADARTGERRVSGRFAIDDTGLLAERLALLFNLSLDRTTAGEIVLGTR